MVVNVVPGEVWWAEPSPTVGREQAGRRPVVIVSGDGYNEIVDTLVIAVPVSSRERGWPNHVPLDATAGVHGWAMTEQVRAISRGRLVGRVGMISDECLAELRDWIADYLR